MGFWDRMKDVVDKGIETSRDVLGKATDKAKELGEKGVIKFEMIQLEREGEKKLIQLGTSVFDLLVKQEKASVTKGTAGIKETLEALADIEQKMDQKEEALKKM